MKKRWLLGGLCILQLSITSLNVAAFSPGNKQYISADNTFYVYVKSGESISASFLRFIHEEVFNTIRGDVKITLEGPDAQPQTCIASKDAAAGEGCRFAPRQASKTGIWRIIFDVPAGSRAFEEVSPTVRWTTNWFSWDITVTGSSGEVHGRIWTERYALRQPPETYYIDDFTHYYVSEDGYLYRVITRGYNGQISILSADSIGIRKGKECTSAYQSTEVANSEYSPAAGTCGNAYKLFFEEPAGDLPTKATKWDGTEDWVRPSISRPAISELTFISDNSSDQLSGNITFYLRHFIGQYQVKIDVDNDGSFEGQNDVTLNQQMKRLDEGLQRIRFSGSDRQGHIIPPSSHIGIRVAITKVAEIHFVAADVEGRTGGLELVRVNGKSAPSSVLCWNDNELAPIVANLMTPKLDGRACPGSTGGLHSWAYDDLSWGNRRYIDDWAYASADLVGKNQIIYPESQSNSTTSQNINWTMIVIVVVVSLLILIALIFTLFFLRLKTMKRKKTFSAQDQTPEKGVEQQLPSDKDKW